MQLAIANARHQRNGLLRAAIDVLHRHTNQVSYGITPTCTEAEMQVVASYAQALRDVPQQRDFPYNIVWPETPPALSKHIHG